MKYVAASSGISLSLRECAWGVLGKGGIPRCQLCILFDMRSRLGTLLTQASDGLFTSLLVAWSKRNAHAIGVPWHVVSMVLLIEDKRFPIHPGFDVLAVGRAILYNFSGGHLQGGSTIPQQVWNIRTRSSRYHGHRSAYKLRQLLGGLVLDFSNSKSSLFREYLATVYWGRSFYGLEAASFGYFGVSPHELTALQALFLAERIANPNRRSPERIRNVLNRSAIQKILSSYATSCDISLAKGPSLSQKEIFT